MLKINWHHVGVLLALVGLGVVLSVVEAHLNRLSWLIALALPYLFPALVAWTRRHHQRQAITALNLLLGWTFVGWVVALVQVNSGYV
jgi:phosphotransferase system  glucose/maltose/N-acetylglucosamine-specific IIC component